MAASKKPARRKPTPAVPLPIPREQVTREALLDIAGSAIARAHKKPDGARVAAVLTALRAVAAADAVTAPARQNCISKATIVLIEREVLGIEGGSDS